MKAKCAMKSASSKLPTTFVDLVKQAEAALKRSACFTVVAPAQQEAPPLKSVKLVEVRCLEKGSDVEVTLILDATFKGRIAPHKVSLDKELMAKLGVSDISMGMGAAPYDSGIVVKGLALRVRPDFLAGPLANEVKALRAVKVPKITAKTVKRATQTKPYKQLQSTKERLAAEAQALAAQLAAVQQKLVKLAKKERSLLQATLTKAATPRRARQGYSVVAV